MWACVRRIWRIASDLRWAYASSACTPSPGSMRTASFVFSQPTTKPFSMKGPAGSTQTIMTADDHRRSRRSHVQGLDQDYGLPPHPVGVGLIILLAHIP